MPLLNYTTKVPVSRTVEQVSRMLASAGASAVTTSYDMGRPAGLSFVINGAHGDRWYTMPVNVAGVHRVLCAQHAAGEVNKALTTVEHAARVAWRIARDWLAVQLALVEAGMAAVDQIMLPYLHVDVVDGRAITVYDRYREHEQFALTTSDSAERAS